MKKKFMQIYQSSILIFGALVLMVLCWWQRREINSLKEENIKVNVQTGHLHGGDLEKAAAMDSLQHIVDSLQNEIDKK